MVACHCHVETRGTTTETDLKSVSSPGTENAAQASSEAMEGIARQGRPWSFFCLVGLCLTASTVAVVFGNPATKVLVPLFALATLNGYWAGALKLFSGTLGLVIGGLLAFPVGQACEGWVGRLFGLTGLSCRMASIAAFGVLMAVFAIIFLEVLIFRKLRRRPGVVRYDKWAGGGLGMVQGVLVVLVLLWAVLALEPMVATRLAMSQNPGTEEPDPAVSRISDLVQVARESFVGRLAGAANPLNDLRMVTIPRKCMVMLSDPVALDAFNRHPAIEGLRQRPVVQEVVKVLAEDPEIARIIDSDDQITQYDVLALLRSPSLLAVLDGTDIMAELIPITDEIEEALNQSLAHSAKRRAPHTAADSDHSVP